MHPTLNHTTFRILAVAALALAGGAASAQATIDHSKALAGNVTPGDAAGYPITISKPGHYVLKSNLVVPAGLSGIEITAPNVTLDLNGFSIKGPGTCTISGQTAVVSCSVQGSGWGVGTTVVPAAAKVRNGAIEGFRYGVVLDGGAVEDLAVRHNSGTGIQLSATYGSLNRVAGVIVELNATGISTEGDLITDALVTSNTVGIQCVAGSVIASRISHNKTGIVSSGCGVSQTHYMVNKTNVSGLVTPF